MSALPQDSKQQILASLGALALLRELTLAEREAVLDLADPAQVATGETIVAQDAPGDCMYVIVSGSVRVSQNRAGRTLELARLGAGDFFGEIALVDEGPRSADVVALEPCLLLGINQGALRALAGVYPAAAFKLLVAVGRVMVARARATNAQYIDSLLWCKEQRC